MIFTNFNSMAKCTMGFLIFHAVRIVLNVEALPSGTLQGSITFVNSNALAEADLKESDVNNACVATLTGTFNGLLTHDALEVKLDNNIATQIQKEYQSVIIYAFATITTGNNLIAYFCNNIEPLLRLNFNGDKSHDKEMAKLGTNKFPEGGLSSTNEIHRKKYTTFLLGTKVSKSDRKINMFVEYSKELKFLNKPVSKEDEKCRGKLATEEHSGDDDIDIKHSEENLKKKTYDGFIGRLSLTDVSNTNQQNLANIYCDIICVLRANKFTGKKDDDLTVKENARIEDIAHGYKYFIGKPENCGTDDDCIEKYAIYRINYK